MKRDDEVKRDDEPRARRASQVARVGQDGKTSGFHTDKELLKVDQVFNNLRVDEHWVLGVLIFVLMVYMVSRGRNNPLFVDSEARTRGTDPRQQHVKQHT